MPRSAIEFFLDVPMRRREELNLLVRACEVASKPNAVRRADTVSVLCILGNEMGSISPSALVVCLDEALRLVVLAEGRVQLKLGATSARVGTRRLVRDVAVSELEADDDLLAVVVEHGLRQLVAILGEHVGELADELTCSGCGARTCVGPHFDLIERVDLGRSEASYAVARLLLHFRHIIFAHLLSQLHSRKHACSGPSCERGARGCVGARTVSAHHGLPEMVQVVERVTWHCVLGVEVEEPLAYGCAVFEMRKQRLTDCVRRAGAPYFAQLLCYLRLSVTCTHGTRALARVDFVTGEVVRREAQQNTKRGHVWVCSVRGPIHVIIPVPAVTCRWPTEALGVDQRVVRRRRDDAALSCRLVVPVSSGADGVPEA